MLTDPVQRTRVLYKWEVSMVEWPGFRHLTLSAAHKFLDEIWAVCGPHTRRRKPELVFSHKCGLSYYVDGRITLTLNGQDNVTLIHEAVHAMGMGSDTNPHSKGFVERYIVILSVFMPLYNRKIGPWDYDYLRAETEMRLLLPNS